MIQGYEFHIINMLIHTHLRLARAVVNSSRKKGNGITNALLKKQIVIQ
jgi:hypothetical protein